MNNVAVKQKFDVGALTADLLQPSFLGELKAYVDYVVVQDDFTAAYQAQKNLALALEQTAQLQPENRNAWRMYQQCLWRLRAVALPALSDDLVIATLTEGLPVAIAEPDVDLADKLDAKIVRILIHETRDVFKARLREALLKSSVPLFSESSQSVLSISEWLKNYSQTVGYATVEAFKRQQYLNDSPAPRGLKPLQREQLRRLLVLFDTLKLSSLTPEGLEDVMTFEQDGKRLVLNHGQVYEVSQVADPLLAALLPQSNPTQDVAVDNELSVASKPQEPLVEILPPTSVVPSPVVPARPQRVPVVPATLPATVVPAFRMLPEPQAFKQTSPAFVFDIEDEREVDKFRPLGQAVGINLEQHLRGLADGVIQHYKFSFKDEANRRRFVHLFVSFLKDVRNAVEVREVLTKPVATGGLGLVSDKAEQVLMIVTKVKQALSVKRSAPSVLEPTLPAAAGQAKSQEQKTEKPGSPSDIAQFLLKMSGTATPTAPAPTPAKPVPPSPQAPAPTPAAVPTPLEVRMPFGIGTGKVEVATPKVTIARAVVTSAAPVTLPPKPPTFPATAGIPGAFSPEKVQQWRQEMLKEIARVAPPVMPTSPTSPAGGMAGSAADQIRPRLSDVKATPRTMGPVGELKSLGLTDFRRLGTAAQALERVRAKIDLLGEASIGRRLEAVRAWQASPVYQTYLRLGRESIERGSQIADTATALSAEGQEALTEAEFNAIADFNTKLRF